MSQPTTNDKYVTEPGYMTDPRCQGQGCAGCEQSGEVPTWLADPQVNELAHTWQQ